MNIYSLQKINKIIKSDFLKNIAIWLFHIFNKRYLAIYLDPILACNLRCRSCYFSNENRRKELKGSFKYEDLPRIAESIFSKAIKLQIGCGAEPTLFKQNSDLIRLGKKYGISYISLTTNANLLTKDEIINLLDAGLDELTISLHGIKKETYEYLMPNASYEKLLEVMGILANLKTRYPKFKLRLNYTVNNLNINELKSFFDVFGEFSINILQLRSLRDIGGDIRSVETNDSFNSSLDKTVQLLKTRCIELGVTFIAPEKLPEENTERDTDFISSATYCYISPKVFWQQDFDWQNETFNQYARRTNYASKLFRNIFFKG